MTLAEDMELKILRMLEKEVSAMFSFSGWADGVDPDAARTVRSVESVLRLLDAMYQVIDATLSERVRE